MIRQFKSFIKEKKLFAPADKILLAVSGGLDSVVMAHLFKEAGFEFGMAHCNFRLRGEESEGDEKFVRELAEYYKVKLVVRNFETGEYAQEKGVSVQMAARDLRYSFFADVCMAHGFKYVATAHHADDFTETVLMNLVRGSGLTALHGIPSKNKKIIRPILFASRKDIENYAKQYRLTWREDSSNHKDDYTRNKIRHHVIPLLKEINPSLTTTFLNNAAHIEEAEAVFREYVKTSIPLIAEEKKGQLEIDIKRLRELVAPSAVLANLLKPYGFNSRVCAEILESLPQTETKMFFAGSWIAIKEREKIRVSKHSTRPDDSFSIAGPGDYRFTNGQLWVHPVNDVERTKKEVLQGRKQNKNEVFLDADRLTFPLLLRHWEQGDSFIPLGMTGSKQLSDYFIDEKFSIAEKQHQFLLLADNTVLWVLGKRISAAAKITVSTKSILQITIAYDE